MTAFGHDIDLEAFARNLRMLRARVAPAELMLVVKDDAYRHGLRAILPRALDEGVRWFGAFDVQTGERLLRATPASLRDQLRVFVWTLGGMDDADRAVRAGMDVGVGERTQLELVRAAGARAGRPASVHLKIDTGLHRNGFRAEEWDEALRVVETGREDGALALAGVWSHIAEASDREDDAARDRFDEAVARVRAAGLAPGVRHLAASAASSARPGFRYDLVRVGAFAYGIRPAGGPGEAELGIEPVMTVSAEVVEIEHDAAVLGAGSLDGLPSTLAGRMSVDPPVGDPVAVRRIDEYLTRVDLWPSAAIGDRVAVFGPASRAGRSATDLGEAVDTIGEEIVLRTGTSDGTLR